MDVGTGGVKAESSVAAGDPRACLDAISRGRSLDAAESEALFSRIMRGESSPILIGALLAALRTRGETADEMAGAARVMRAHLEPLQTRRAPLVDTCGTGGDGSGTFNVSTTAALVAAAAGVAVAKHGNRAASSRSGSADLLEALGVVIDLPPVAAGRCLDEVGLAFLYAPRFHPAMRHAIEARRTIGIRSIFNLLGPLTNPAGARRQVVGVPAERWLEPMARVLLDLGAEHALVVHGEGGLDEISVSGPTRIIEVRDGALHPRTLTPADLGLETHPITALAGGDATENARITTAILSNQAPPAHTAFTAANAGAALYVAGQSETIEQGVRQAEQILESGAATAKVEQLVEVTRRLSAESE